jgi:DNA-directed RNA polymerase subunit RPC12/RpoP
MHRFYINIRCPYCEEVNYSKPFFTEESEVISRCDHCSEKFKIFLLFEAEKFEKSEVIKHA